MLCGHDRSHGNKRARIEFDVHVAGMEPFGELRTKLFLLWLSNLICVVLARLNHVSEGPFKAAVAF